MTSWRAAVAVGIRAILTAAAVAVPIALTHLHEGLRDPVIGPVLAPDPSLLISYLVAGFALLGAGIVAAWTKVTARAGSVAILVGLAWFAPDLAQLSDGPVVVLALAPASGILVAPLAVHLILEATPGRREAGAIRRASRLVDILAVAVALTWVLTYSPFHDAACVASCDVSGAPLGLGLREREILRTVSHAVVSLSGGLLMVVGAQRLSIAVRRDPRRMLLAIGGVVVGAAVTGLGVVGLWTEISDGATPGIDPRPTLYVVASVGMVAVALGLLVATRQVQRSQRTIRQLARGFEVAPRPGALAASLAGALDDVALRVGYRLEDEDAYVDADGSSFVTSAAAPGRTLTTIARAGTSIGVIDHREDLDMETLSRELRPSVLIAIDNERWRAVQLARLHDLRASRAKIVEVADAERRRIERDLHDGAQQQLLAIAFDLRLARSGAEQLGRADAVARYARAESIALGLVDELRRICQGIHPQVLAQAGLEPALASLAEESSIAVEIHATIDARPPAGVETAAYHVVREAIDQAGRRGAEALIVDVTRAGDELEVRTTDGLAEGLSVPLRLADRVGAVGGEILAGFADGSAFMRAVLPCA